MTTQRFPLTGPINLNVRTGHGAVQIETEDDLTEASVTLDAASPDELAQFTVELHGATLDVLGPNQGGIFDLGWFGRRSRRGVDVRITVPTGTAVKVGTYTAPVTIRGRVGGADLAFGSGQADVAEVDGDLRLRFGRGSARVRLVRGSAQVRSGHGDAVLGEVGADLNAGCGNGRLQVEVVRGRVRSRCGSGAAHLGAVHGDVDLASGSGAVDVGIPAGVSAYLDLHTGSGQVRSELPVEGSAAPTNTSIAVRARTGSGDIRLFRAAQTDAPVAVD